MVAVLSEWWLVPTTADHCGHIPVPYSREVRQVESLANLAKRLQFAKLQSYKLVVTINIVLADPYFSTQHLKRVNSLKSYYLLMMPRSINQLDVKLTTCNSNVILLHCIDGQKLGYLILILVSVTCYI